MNAENLYTEKELMCDVECYFNLRHHIPKKVIELFKNYSDEEILEFLKNV